MSDPTTQDILKKLNEISIRDLEIEPIKITTGINGTSASDIYSMNSTAIPSLTVDSINWGVNPNSFSSTTGTTLTYPTPNTIWTTTGTGSAVGGVAGNQAKLSLRGENADIDINGKSLKNWMTKVEERLNILTPNAELEKEWDELRELGERYRELEQRCKEKAETWKKLKAMPPPTVD